MNCKHFTKVISHKNDAINKQNGITGYIVVFIKISVMNDENNGASNWNEEYVDYYCGLQTYLDYEK